MEIVLQNQPAEKQRLLKALQAFAVDQRLPDKVVQAADLALEEHLTNVLNYGYTDTAIHEVRVRFSRDATSFQIEVEDDGRAFNPLEKPEVDASIPLEDRPVGGLGIHLMRRFMDALDYRREGDRNILRMTKRLDA